MRWNANTLKLLATAWRSSATILTLFNKFESTINNSVFALTSSIEYDIQDYLHVDNASSPRKLNKNFILSFNDNSSRVRC